MATFRLKLAASQPNQSRKIMAKIMEKEWKCTGDN
jgi:hypothetical protein